MAESLEDLSIRLSSVENKIDSLLSAIKEAADIRQNNTNIINNNFELIDQKIDSVEDKITSIEETVDVIEEKVGIVDDKVGDLHSHTKKNFKEVKFELVKIQKITSYDEMYDNMKVVNGDLDKK